jgi:hypothetical protein
LNQTSEPELNQKPPSKVHYLGIFYVLLILYNSPKSQEMSLIKLEEIVNPLGSVEVGSGIYNPLE